MSLDPADTGSGLVLRPFRATRYGPAAGGDIGAVTSPPYDVIDEETVERLYSCHPYNVVRLILPRRFAQAPSYGGVRRLLQQWRNEQVLVEDDEPALYVYEYTDGEHVVRGVIGALGLRDRSSGTVLPHEDVMPGPVRDRAELITHTETNLEPILLVYDGNGAASDVADAVTDADRLVGGVAPDESAHSVWRVTDPTALRRVAEDLAPRRALIADGHHRYAAYQQVQADRRGSEYDYGLAMLVDQHRYPLQLGPIHRVVTDLSLDELVRRTSPPCTVTEHGGGAAEARHTAADAPRTTAALVCTDGRRWVVLQAPIGAGEIDTHPLHEHLLRGWGVEEAQVRYVHDADHAVHEAHNHAGVAVLVRPPSVHAVVAASEQGRSLPRKSTSFGPKPRMGLLMRRLPPATA